VDEVARQLNYQRGTVVDFLADYIRAERPASISGWVEEQAYQRVAAAARQVGTDRLRPIFVALGEKVSYDTIKLVVAHLQGQAE
jgi:ATP-dependent DNA helicase RecQ